MGDRSKLSLGIDFGTESVRALLVDLDGDQRASAVVRYPHGQILDALPTDPSKKLPADFALQHPLDWIESAAQAVRAACDKSGESTESIIGIGVDFTSCTMLPTRADGTPLCTIDKFEKRPFAWPKLWKHHGAKSQTGRINAVAQSRCEPFLDCYGGTIGLEWFFPKVLETIEGDHEVAQSADVWLEAGDWFVWQLIGGDVSKLVRSTCQAGYKAMWSPETGFPSPEFLNAVNPELNDVARTKMPGRFGAPGTLAGDLSQKMGAKFGLRPGTPVSVSIIDAHAGVPGAGAGDPGVLVMVLGTSSCHMLNAKEHCNVAGVAGVVKDGILPGYYGYETGQAAVGDAFEWLRTVFGQSHEQLAREASQIAAGSEGVRCLDWMNGCRTPLMDGNLSGAFTGLKLRHTSAHMYRALLEASAFGLRWIVETMRDGGLMINRFVATGGLPHHNPQIVQIYADVLGRPISVHPCEYGPALGAAILGAMAAGSESSGFETTAVAIESMAGARPNDPRRHARTFSPNAQNAHTYEVAYKDYRNLAQNLRQ